MAIVTAQIATLFARNLQSVANAQDLDSADIEIHAVIDKIRNLGTSYNWCSASGSANTSNCTAYVQDNPQGFYSPSSGNLASFLSNCKQVALYNQPSTDRIVANLATSLNTLSSSDPRQGVYISSTFEDVRIRRFKISLSRTIQINGSDRTLRRWFYLIPDLAAWCP